MIMNKRGQVLHFWWYTLLGAILIIIVLFLKVQQTPTGFFVYDEVSNSKTWDFSTAEYIYDAALLNLSGNEAKLKSTTTTTTTTVTTISEAALRAARIYEKEEQEYEDELEKIQSIANGHVELKDNEETLELTFNASVTNGDILSLYIISGSTNLGRVFLCSTITGCSSGAYGSLTLSSEGGNRWYNITVSSLPSSTSLLFIDSSDKVKIDMAKAYISATTTQTNTTITYPSSGTVETADLQPLNWKQWGSFSKTEQLNEGTITYAYSNDSGSTWTTMPANLNLSFVMADKIRIKATLTSSGSSTPSIAKMMVEYITQQHCTESWSCSGWTPGTCPANGTQTRTCTDANICGTNTNKPAETTSCSYICTGDWSCSAWSPSPCPKNGTQARSCTDANTCGTTTNRPSLNQSCTYVPPCVENWTAAYGNCLSTDTRLKYYIDISNCGTTAKIPADNGTSTTCDFCVPTVINQNGTCRHDNRFISSFRDGNACYEQTGLASDVLLLPGNTSYNCRYCAENGCVDSTEVSLNETYRINSSSWIIDAMLSVKTKLEVTGAAGIEPRLSQVWYNVSGKEIEATGIAVGRFIALNMTDGTLNRANFIMYYLDEELSSRNVAEDSLAVYQFADETWAALTTTINQTGNYASATINRTGFYGLYGQNQSSNATNDATNESSGGSIGDSPGSPGPSGGGSSSGGSSDGGGGGGSSRRVSTVEQPAPSTAETTEQILPVRAENTRAATENARTSFASTSCDPVITVSLPKGLSLIKEPYQGQLENAGDCAIGNIQLQLSPELTPFAQIQPNTFEQVERGEHREFTIIPLNKRVGWYSTVTGLATTPFTQQKTISGAVVIAVVGPEPETEELGLIMEVEVLKEAAELRTILVGTALTVILLGAGIFVVVKRKLFGKGRKKK